ncbi:PREDICTED: protein FAR1-RELATED SEQUENCE 7-like [Lupinus angustifolius]|uniref:protein FAR1-RELATED SEQUENCE 7-like n=1 Tax=Lupinus angustifolius TaxID=3871 RepID=UPI00092E8AEC|nr:PREDICTED: protein FAR1-RELATED SEQUENCE 7-like [Lupinus angustifolius]
MEEMDEEVQSRVQANFEKNEAPQVGIPFTFDKVAYDFYNSFAFREGFSIRKNWNYKARNTEIIIKYHFVCNKEGFKRLDKRLLGKEVKRRRDEREGCKVYMHIKKTKEGDWVVNKFSNTHNHELIISPTKKYRLHSHNNAHKSSCIKSLVENINGCGLGPAQISRLVNVMSDESIMVTPKQVVGQLRVNRKNNIGKECMVVLNKFLERQALDSQFFYAFEIDKDNVCRSIFWADGRARNAYLKFCDVIVFDVTYKTNSFSMSFAPFIGVNHHRQSTLFGCALLADEREETFVWLFKQWLRCMWDKAPGAIITDQDVAIGNAIKRVFPHAHHRYCSCVVGIYLFMRTNTFGLFIPYPSSMNFIQDGLKKVNQLKNQNNGGIH